MLGFCSALLLLCPTVLPAEPPQRHAADLSGIERFWPVYDALRSDRDPSDQEWSDLFATPGWRTLGRFRAQSARERYELAFRPSKEAARAEAIGAGGYEAGVLRHLRTIADRETELRAYYAALMRGSERLDIDAAVRRAAEFLPPGSTGTGAPPAVAVVFFERDGYADQIVVVDLLYVLELGVEATALLAHEFHHAYQGRLVAPFTRPAGGSADQILLETLFQLQREGIANLIDKQPALAVERFADPAVERFRAEVARSPEVLAAMEERLVQMASADTAALVGIMRDIRWRVLPNSGHPTGLYMAKAILDELGKEALVSTLANPFDFVRAYNLVATRAGGTIFGSEAMAVLSAAESRIFGQAVMETPLRP
jgi:hypothetical protein